MFQSPRTDVLAIVHAVEADLHDRVVGALHRIRQVFAARGHTQHAPARGVISAITPAGAGMENLHSVDALSFVQTAEELARLEPTGIAARCHHDADRRIMGPAEVALADASFDGRLNRLKQVAFHAHHDGLGLRIAEAAIELQHHGPARRHHNAAIEDAFVLRALGPHAGDDRTRDVAHQPVAHLGIDHLVGRISAHAAGVRALVIVEYPLVVLRSHQRNYALAIAHHQERQLFALQTLLEYHARSGLAQHLAAEHVFGGALRVVLALRDDDTLAGGETVGLHYDRSMKQLKGFDDLFVVGAHRVFRRGDAV